MGALVAKFGGSSLADASQFIKVRDIIVADSRRRYVVPSAPGKRFSEDEKVTDLLYACHALAQKGQSIDEVFAKITERYVSIRDALKLSIRIEDHLEQVRFGISSGQSADYAASRGEYLNGLLLADYLGYDFIDAAEVVLFDADDRFDADRTDEVLRARLSRHERAVLPGFYGSLTDGRIKTFSRGGSDISGAIVARAAHADVYENWTDVSGFLMADPRVVENPRVIKTITYRELRELSYMGASVLHDEAIFPVRQAGIPINIKNTNSPSDPGTMIVRECADQANPITGLAGKKGFSAIAIDKTMMNSELGFGRKVLQALEESGVSFEHLPTGIDTMTVVMQDANLNGHQEEILTKIRRECRPDHMELLTGISMIATVGRGMVAATGIAARIFSAMAKAGVNIRLIDQGSSELSIIVGVETSDFETAMRAIYQEFVGQA